MNDAIRIVLGVWTLIACLFLLWKHTTDMQGIQRVDKQYDDVIACVTHTYPNARTDAELDAAWEACGGDDGDRLTEEVGR